LPSIPEKAARSAPPKTGSHGRGGSQGTHAHTALTSTESVTESKLLQLGSHEELFFHYLSILALLPARRADLLRILDTYGQREKGAGGEPAAGSRPHFDMVQQAEKRLKKFETIVEIPDEAKLLRANTMMLELYVTIMDSMYSITGMGKQNRHIKLDRVYEAAHEMRQFFVELQFQRGLAMIDYVQAKRQIKKFGDVHAFTKLLVSAARGFAESHEVEGI